MIMAFIENPSAQLLVTGFDETKKLHNTLIAFKSKTDQQQTIKEMIQFSIKSLTHSIDKSKNMNIIKFKPFSGFDSADLHEIFLKIKRYNIQPPIICGYETQIDHETNEKLDEFILLHIQNTKDTPKIRRFLEQNGQITQ